MTETRTEWAVRYTWPDGTGHTTRYAEAMAWAAADAAMGALGIQGVTAVVVTRQVTVTDWEPAPPGGTGKAVTA